MSWSPVQGVLPTVRDQETEETQPYAPKREQAPKYGSNEEEKKIWENVSRPVLGPTQPPILWVPGAVSKGVKRPGNKVWPLISS
jgi:hypothetical protein